MRIPKHITALALLCLSLLTACSVKEDRSECPTWLTVDVSRCAGLADVVSVRGYEWEPSEHMIFSDTLRVSSYTDSLRFEREVVRGEIALTYWDGLYHHAKWSGNELRVPEGYECDSLYAGRDVIRMKPDTDEYTAHAHLDKQFLTLTIRFENIPGAETVGQLSADYNGLDLMHFVPVEGEYKVTPRAVGDGRYQVRIPRQTDESVMTLHYSIEDTQFINYSFSISSALTALSYNWDETSLRDAEVTIEASHFTLRVEGWEEVLIGDIDYGGTTL